MSRLFVLVLWIVAGVLPIALYRRYKQVARLRIIGYRTQGVVIGHRPDSSDETTIYNALILFSTQQGHRHQTEAKVGLSIPTPSKGTQVSVIYDPNNPADCFIDAAFEQVGGYVIGVIFWLAAIVSLVFLVF